MGLIGLKSRVSRTDSLSITSTGGSVSLTFPPSSGHPHSLARGPLPTSKQQHCTDSFSYLITLTRTLQPPLSTFKDNCDCVETMRIMQANLPTLKSAISNLIPSISPLRWCSVAQLCPILCGPTDYSPPGSSAHGIFQDRILEGVPFPVPGYLPNPGIEPESLVSPALTGRFFTTSTTWEAHLPCNKAHSQVLGIKTQTSLSRGLFYLP